jgi:hypothetical protein
MITNKQVYRDIKIKKGERTRHAVFERLVLDKVLWPRNLHENGCMRDLRLHSSKDAIMIN